MTNVAVSALPLASAATAAETRLRGRWLVVARVGWPLVVIGTFALFIGGLPTFYALLLQQPCTSVATCNMFGSLQPAQVHILRAAGLSARDVAAYFFGLDVIIVLIWSAVGLVIFWRRSDDWLALLVALALILFNAGQQGAPPTALALVSPAWTLPVEVLSFLSQASFGVLLFLFPNGRFAPRWTRWFALLFLIQTAFSLVPPASLRLSADLENVLSGGAFVSAAAVALYSQIYRYRRVSSPVQREQTKWAVFGIATTIVLVILLDLSNVIPGMSQSSPAYLVLETLFPLALLPIPIFIGVAILRYRLWDIDVIIRRTLVYGVLTATLAALYFGLVIGLQAAVATVDRQASQSPIIIVATTLLIAALFTPLRRRVQATIDRRFYRSKYDAARTLAAFGMTLRTETDLAELSAHLLAVVQETMQPEHVSLWLRPSDRGAAHPDQSRRLSEAAQITPRVRAGSEASI